MSAPSEVTIGHPGWRNRRLIPTSPPSISWRTDGPGSLDCVAVARTLELAGYQPISRAGLIGQWIWYEHPTAGAWGGVITSVSKSGPWVNIGAEQFAVLLRRRKISANWRSTPESPGGLVMLYLTAAERAGENLGLTSYTAEQNGEPIDFEPRAGDLCDDIIPELAEYGYQWTVRTDTMDERAFVFRRRIGTDKRRRVQLTTSRHILADSDQVDIDLWTVANAIEGIAGGQQTFREAKGYVLESRASIKALGRRFEEQIAYDGVATKSTIAPLVKRDLARYAWPTAIATYDVIDAEDCWRDFREGDTITIADENAGVVAPFQIDVRSLDVSSGLVTISGELLIGEA